MLKTIDILKELGANKVVAYVTHGLFNGSFYENLTKAKIDRVYTTDSYDIRDSELEKNSKVTRLTLAGLVDEYIEKRFK